MRFKNRKGSTLALTIMIFAVLMIFATFTLGFMVTENKQAMYHQNKTQAYYIARSGAVAVEDAIIQVFNSADYSKISVLMSSLSEIPVEISADDISGLEDLLINTSADLSIKLSKAIDDSIIFIESDGKFYDQHEIVRKAIPIEISIETSSEVLTISGSKPLIVLESASNNLMNKGWVHKEDDPDIQDGYKTRIDNIITAMDSVRPSVGSSPPDGAGTRYWGSISNPTSYFINGSFIPIASKIILQGDVDLYISGNLQINHDIQINTNNPKKLNIYIYGDTENLFQSEYSLFIGNYQSNQNHSKVDFDFNGNFFIKNGNISYNVKDSKFTGNIFTASETIGINAQTSNTNDYSFKGLILAPYADILLGAGTDQFVTIHEGFIIADSIVHSKDQIQQKTLYGVPNSGVGEITTEIITTEKIMTPLVGYFR